MIDPFHIVVISFVSKGYEKWNNEAIKDAKKDKS